jgi:hypothetical protein
MAYPHLSVYVWNFVVSKYYIFQIPTRNNNVRTIQRTGAYHWGKLDSVSLENLEIKLY